MKSINFSVPGRARHDAGGIRFPDDVSEEARSRIGGIQLSPHHSRDPVGDTGERVVCQHRIISNINSTQFGKVN